MSFTCNITPSASTKARFWNYYQLSETNYTTITTGASTIGSGQISSNTSSIRLDSFNKPGIKTVTFNFASHSSSLPIYVTESKY